MATPESKVKTKVRSFLATLKAWVFMPVQTGYGKSGVPDIIACVPYTIRPEDVGKTVGLFVGVETKAPGKIGNVTPLQARELDAISEAGGLAIVDDGSKQCEKVLTLRIFKQ